LLKFVIGTGVTIGGIAAIAVITLLTTILIRQDDTQDLIRGMEIKITAGNERAENIEKRVNRIADALPALQTQVAFEQVNRPFHGALILTDPIAKIGGGWDANGFLFDANAGTIDPFILFLEDSSTSKLEELVGSLLYEGITSGVEYTSFTKLEDWALQIEEPATSPGYIYPSGSFIWRDSDPSVRLGALRLLKDAGFRPARPGSAESPVIWGNTWAKLSDSIEIYLTPQDILDSIDREGSVNP